MLAKNGYLTYATMRNLKKDESLKSSASSEHLPIRTIQLDVTDDDSVQNAIKTILSDAGRIDVLVNNAGYGLTGAFEDVTIDEAKSQFETNFFGMIRVTQAVLPAMRRQKSGTIVNVSSGAGRFGLPGGSIYSSSKFAVEGLSESMAYELDPFGIKVILVEPGVIRTNFDKGVVMAKKSLNPDSPYSNMIQNVTTAFGDRINKNSSSPGLVAEVILNAVKSRNPDLRYLAGKDVEEWIESKKQMSDSEFYTMMKQGFGGNQ
jgi:NAD(P)-dependent dehydrogenase (short-subunit alcohol dehydrogenase family)